MKIYKAHEINQKISEVIEKLESLKDSEDYNSLELYLEQIKTIQKFYETIGIEKNFLDDPTIEVFQIINNKDLPKINTKLKKGLSKMILECYCQIAVELKESFDISKEIYKTFKNNIKRTDGKSLEDDINNIIRAADKARKFLDNEERIGTSSMAEKIDERIQSKFWGILICWLAMILFSGVIMFSPKIIEYFFLDSLRFSIKEHYLFLFPVISPSIVLFFYFSKRSQFLFRQKTDYEFKLDSINVFMNYDSISSLPTERVEIKIRLLNNLINALAENPTRLLEKQTDSLELKEILTILNQIKAKQ